MKSLGPDRASVALSINNLALLYDSLGDCQKEEPLLRRAISIYEKAFGPDHPELITSLNNLGGLYLETGRFEDAYAIFKRIPSYDALGHYYLMKLMTPVRYFLSFSTLSLLLR